MESGLLYMLSEAAMLVSDLFGNAAVCVADAVGQTIVSAALSDHQHRRHSLSHKSLARLSLAFFSFLEHTIC